MPPTQRRRSKGVCSKRSEKIICQGSRDLPTSIRLIFLTHLCLIRPKRKTRLQRSFEFAKRKGTTDSPSIFINGTRHSKNRSNTGRHYLSNRPARRTALLINGTKASAAFEFPTVFGWLSSRLAPEGYFKKLDSPFPVKIS